MAPKVQSSVLLFVVFAAGITCGKAAVSDNGFSSGLAQIKGTSHTSSSYVPDRCFLNPEPGRCRAWLPQYYFNVSSGDCQEFIYGGCGGNSNRFQSFRDCQKECTCKTAPETGPCRGHIRRWYYSSKDGVCRPFIFGGCGGNSNNYASWHECSNVCGYPDHSNSWCKWWNSDGRCRDTGSGATGTRGYSEADFMKDYMMLGMLGEIEWEGTQGILNLYLRLQQMGGLSTMQSGQVQGIEGSNQGSVGMNSGGQGVNGAGHLGADASWGSAIDGQSTDLWGQGSSRQSGAENRGFGNGLSVGSGFDAFTPLGQIGGGGGINTFTTLGDRGSLVNALGTGSSSMAQELEVLKSILGIGSSGQSDINFGNARTSAFDTIGWAPSGGFSIIEFMKHLAAGRLTPNSMMLLSRTLGAVDRTGKIDVNIMLSQLSQTMANLGPGINEQLKEVARRFGALDMYGDIDMNKFLHALAGSIGGLVAQMSRVVGSGSVWPADSGLSGTDFVAFIQQLGSGRLSPADMSIVAKSLGVLDNRGKININAMVQRLMDALTNPGIAADLHGTAKRLGALNHNGTINVEEFLRRIASSAGSRTSSFGTSGSAFGTSGAEILRFITRLAAGRASNQDIREMASKVGAVDGLGNINFVRFGKGVIEALKNPTTMADLNGLARHVGALDRSGNVDMGVMLRGISGVLTGPFGEARRQVWPSGRPDRTSEAHFVRSRRSARKHHIQSNGVE